MTYPTLKGNILIENKNKKGEFTSLYTSGSGNVELDISKILDNTSTPPGFVAMFSGSKIPDGWALCNGQSINGVGTYDLRGYFIQGTTNKNELGQTSGSNDLDVMWHEHKITFHEYGNHIHSANPSGVDSTETGAHRHIAEDERTGYTHCKCCVATDWSDTLRIETVGVKSGDVVRETEKIKASQIHNHTVNPGAIRSNTKGDHSHKITIKATGTSGKNLNMPPYYTLVYIQKINK